jgi:glyoxylase-like metal-dependent hydrolase (beta-lactamase superfamily II)
VIKVYGSSNRKEVVAVLTRVNGNTYFIPAPTNIGVFQFKDRYALLVDSGSDNQQARRICDILQDSELSPRYLFLTHSHHDHSGGHAFIRQNFPGCKLMAHEGTKAYLNHPGLLAQYIYGGQPPASLSRSLNFKPAFPEEELTEGMMRIHEEKFTIVELPGHAPGQCGLITKDRVCFLGDSLFSEDILQKYSFPFLYDIGAQLKTYEAVEQIDADYFILGHGPDILSHEQMLQLCALNRSSLHRYLGMIMDLLDQPKSREELLEEIIILDDLNPDLHEYYFLASTLAAMLSHLQQQENLTMQIENGRLYFFKG